MLNKKIINTVSLLTLSLTVSSCGHFSKKWFDKVDSNSNGYITKKEFNKYTRDKFKNMDLNKDKKISKEEFANYKKNKKKK